MGFPMVAKALCCFWVAFPGRLKGKPRETESPRRMRGVLSNGEECRPSASSPADLLLEALLLLDSLADLGLRFFFAPKQGVSFGATPLGLKMKGKPKRKTTLSLLFEGGSPARPLRNQNAVPLRRSRGKA